MKSIKELPPIFVVSLAKDKKRRAYITKELAKHKLNYRFIDAIDGSLLKDDYISKVYSKAKAIEQAGVPLTKGEIGCALSHISIWQKMVSENIEKAIIFEDDIILSDVFLQVINNINDAAPKNWELILFGHNNNENGIDSICQLSISKYSGLVDFYIKKPMVIASCTFAYMVNKQGAKLLIEKTDKLYKPIDYYTGDYKLINLYTISPMCVKVDFSLQSALKQERSIVRKERKIPRKKYFIVNKLSELNRIRKNKRKNKNKISCIVRILKYKATMFFKKFKIKE